MTTRGERYYQQAETQEQRRLRLAYEKARDEYLSTVEICQVRYRAMMEKLNQWQAALFTKESTDGL